MNSGRWAALVFGVILLLAGTVFALQGAGYIGGSSMTGSQFWVYAGGAVLIVGLLLIVVSVATRPKVQRTRGVPTTP